MRRADRQRKQHQRAVLTKLRELQVDGVRVLHRGPADTPYAASDRLEPLLPCPQAALLLELAMEDAGASGWFVDAIRDLWDHFRQRSDPRPSKPRILIEKLAETGVIAWRRAAGDVGVVDLDAQRMYVTTRWPHGPRTGVIVAIDESEWRCAFETGVRLAERGLEALRPVESTVGFLTAQQVAGMFKVRVDTVYGWRKAGLLKMTNTSAADAKKPRWLVSRVALEEFQSKRQPAAPEPPPQRRKRGNWDPDFTEYF